MAYERFSLGRNKSPFGEEESPFGPPMGTAPVGLPPPELMENHPVNAPLQQQDLLKRGPLDIGQNPFQAQRPTFDPGSLQIGQSSPELPQAPPPAQSGSSFMDEYTRLTSNRPERENYRNLVNNAPKREDYKPNKMTRLGAILGGVSAGFKDAGKGMELAQSTLDRPFNQAQEEYEKKLRNVSSLAGMESEDIEEKLRGLSLGKADERDTRDHEFKVREFDARMEELKDKDWEKITDDASGRYGWTNRKTGETIYGPQVNEPRSAVIKREADTAAALAKSHEKIAGMQVEGRNEVNQDKIAAAKELATMKSKAALDKLKYAPMSETQRTAGLKEKLQNIASSGIDPFDYLDVDDSGIYTMNKQEQGMTYGMLTSDKELERKKNERAIVQSALDSGRGIVSEKKAGGVEIPIGNGFTLRKPG